MKPGKNFRGVDTFGFYVHMQMILIFSGACGTKRFWFIKLGGEGSHKNSLSAIKTIFFLLSTQKLKTINEG